MVEEDDSTPEEAAQSRRAFIKKITYVTPAVVTYKVGESWASSNDDDDDGGNKKKQKGASPNPGLKKKYRVEDDD